MVLTAAGLLLGLAAGWHSALGHRRLMVAAQTLAGDLRMFEARARSDRTCYRVDFSPAGVLGPPESYTAYRYIGLVLPAPAGGGSPCTDRRAWAPEPIIGAPATGRGTRGMPPGIDLVSTTFVSGGVAHRLEISPLGNMNAGTVTLRSPAGQERRVVQEVLGRVRIVP